LHQSARGIKPAIALLASAMIYVALPTAIVVAADLPAPWAYIPNNYSYKPPVDDGNLVRVPDSTAAYTWTQLRDLFMAPIWHPNDHGPLPDIVAKGRKPDVLACGFCHRADGPGAPENADLAGLSKNYIIRQMADYRSGARSTAIPDRLPPKVMIALSKAITDAEVEAAATYFSSLQPRKRIKVVETETAPKPFIAGFVWGKAEGSEREVLGQRIVEVADDLKRFESRDSRMTYTAYVPVGSLARGEALVTQRDKGETIACAACHGPDLKGLGPVPSIVGRSPSYMFRQLYDFQHGHRTGEWSPLMTQAVSNLGQGDMLAIVAYLASLDP